MRREARRRELGWERQEEHEFTRGKKEDDEKGSVLYIFKNCTYFFLSFFFFYEPPIPYFVELSHKATHSLCFGQTVKSLLRFVRVPLVGVLLHQPYRKTHSHNHHLCVAVTFGNYVQITLYHSSGEFSSPISFEVVYSFSITPALTTRKITCLL